MLKKGYFKKGIALLNLLLIFVPWGCAQHMPAQKPNVTNPEFDRKISSMISFSVPLMSIEELNKRQNEVLLLDAREKEEYQTSHIKGAKYIGYNEFDPATLTNIPKNKEIVLYCSIGYRSEKIGEQLKKLGYNHVYNLYGSIFEWVNQGYPVVNEDGTTTKLHTYNKSWSKWVDSSKVEKTW